MVRKMNKKHCKSKFAPSKLRSKVRLLPWDKSFDPRAAHSAQNQGHIGPETFKKRKKREEFRSFISFTDSTLKL